MCEVCQFLKVSLCDVSELFTHFTKLSVHGTLWCRRKDNIFVTVNLLITWLQIKLFFQGIMKMLCSELFLNDCFHLV